MRLWIGIVLCFSVVSCTPNNPPKASSVGGKTPEELEREKLIMEAKMEGYEHVELATVGLVLQDDEQMGKYVDVLEKKYGFWTILAGTVIENNGQLITEFNGKKRITLTEPELPIGITVIWNGEEERLKDMRKGEKVFVLGKMRSKTQGGIFFDGERFVKQTGKDGLEGVRMIGKSAYYKAPEPGSERKQDPKEHK